MYAIEIAPAALKSLEKIAKSNRTISDRLVAAIDHLKDEPDAGKSLVGDMKPLRSLRVGDYRIIYRIFRDTILIKVIAIGHRRDVYR